MSVTAMTELDLSNQRVLIREDLNVPIRNGIITSDKRILAALPTIQLALEQNAAVILLSHLGRPNEGEFDEGASLQPVADYLSKALGKDVPLIKDYLNGVDVAPGQVVMCENVRFNVGEVENDESLAKRLAALADIFVMDAFGTAHRAHASTCGVTTFAKTSCAGPLLIAELTALKQVMQAPKKPIVAIVGGSKVSSKLSLLKNLVDKVDTLIVGGGIANTFLKAAGVNIGQSLYEDSLVAEAKALLDGGKTIPLARDVVVAKVLSDTTPAYNKSLSEIAADDMILDMGPETVNEFIKIINQAGTIIWNGPIGVFECAPFAYGTRQLAFAIADSEAFSIAGGGDTLAAIDKYNLNNKISYISTGGGAFLEFLEGKSLPAVTALEQRASSQGV